MYVALHFILMQFCDLILIKRACSDLFNFGLHTATSAVLLVYYFVSISALLHSVKLVTLLVFLVTLAMIVSCCCVFVAITSLFPCLYRQAPWSFEVQAV